MQKPVVQIRQGNWKPKRRRRRLRPQAVALLVFLALAAVGLAVFLILYNGRVYTRVEIEAGDYTLSPADFSKNGHDVAFDPAFDPDSVNFHVPGKYPVKLKSGLFRYTASLLVKDSVSPEAKPLNKMLSRGALCLPEELVTAVKDETKLSFSFEKEPDVSALGAQNVTVILTDLGGNETRVSSTLTVIPLYTEITREAGGDAPAPADFVFPGETVAALATVTETGESTSVDFAALMAAPGEYPLYFAADGLLCRCVLKVADTTPPVLTLKDAKLGVGSAVKAEYFVADVKDAGEVTLSVDFSAPLDKEGSQTVTVTATDASGNTSSGTAKLTLVKDTKAPDLHGADDFLSYVGKTISYLAGVWAKDDLDPEPTLDVDSSAVDTKTAGQYTVIYSATDASGNRTEKSVTLTIIPETVSEDAVRTAARAVVDSIITADMTPRDKLNAIYKWMKSHVSYREGASIEDWLRAAYQGLTQHQGDCSVFQMTTRALLDAAGIENRLIDTVPYYNVHVWNLVNIGEGWYHFDTTSFYDKQDFCYVDSATLAARSVHYPRSHTFDQERFSYVV